MPGGANIGVTSENKHEYLALLFRHRMLDAVREQLWQLVKGLAEALGHAPDTPSPLAIFDYQELQLLIAGVPEVDVVSGRTVGGTKLGGRS